MFARLARAVKCPLNVRYLPLRGTAVASTSATADPVKYPRIDEGPERDLVNFPRPTRIDQTPVRMVVIPEEWFHAMYDKSGVCGPYILTFGAYIFMVSKEFIVCDHDLVLFQGMVIVGTVAYNLLSPVLRKFVDDLRAEEEKKVEEFEEANFVQLERAIENEKHTQHCAKNESLLFEAKRENVHMQLETEFRRRQMEVYKKVKSQLDCQLQLQNVARSFQQKNLIDWVVSSVQQSITPQQEQAILKQCYADLKTLSKNA